MRSHRVNIEENVLRIFEGNILREIYGLVQWGEILRIRNNIEGDMLMEGSNIVGSIKSSVYVGLDLQKRCKRTECPNESRTDACTEQKKRKPRSRWRDQIIPDMKNMKIKN